MPRKDGFETLAEIKADDRLRDLPVIVISGIEDTASVVRCIQMGALDHLPKPFEAAVLDARLGSALTGKRLRDLELEYLDQVRRVTSAAQALEADTFDAAELSSVAERDDALGVLARTFVRMAGEVRAREEALRRQVRELTIEIDEARQATPRRRDHGQRLLPFPARPCRRIATERPCGRRRHRRSAQSVAARQPARAAFVQVASASRFRSAA